MVMYIFHLHPIPLLPLNTLAQHTLLLLWKPVNITVQLRFPIHKQQSSVRYNVSVLYAFWVTSGFQVSLCILARRVRIPYFSWFHCSL